MWLLLERIWRRHPLRLLIRAIATAALSVTVLRLVPGQPTGLTARLKRIETMQNPRACMPTNIAAQHVLAAAVRGDAEVLVTFNPGDFPDTATSVHDSNRMSGHRRRDRGPVRGPALQIIPAR